jgi:hypothetical protein
MPHKILHIAPFNTSNVPMTLVRAERSLGYHSRLLTLARDVRGYEEDICLELPFLDFAGTRFVKKFVSDPAKLRVDAVSRVPEKIPLEWHPHGFLEKKLVAVRERIWESKIRTAIREFQLEDFDVYQLDGGLEFYRDGRFISARKKEGKKIICCYVGSDLRTRGVLPYIDETADLNVTVEFDHLALHPDIHHVFFPFEVEGWKARRIEGHSPLLIGHAPTNRLAKKSEVIISVVQSLASEYEVKLSLIENLAYDEAIARKRQCDIFIDQLGDLGYGINALESLAMGIPTCTCLAEGFAAVCPDHPFIEVDELTLRDKLSELIESFALRKDLGRRGREWLAKNHDSVRVVKKIHGLAGL